MGLKRVGHETKDWTTKFSKHHSQYFTYIKSYKPHNCPSWVHHYYCTIIFHYAQIQLYDWLCDRCSAELGLEPRQQGSLVHSVHHYVLRFSHRDSKYHFFRGKQGKEGWDRLRRLTGMSWRILAVFKISAENPVGKTALTDFSFLLPVAPKAGDIFESSDLFSLNTASDVHFNLDISRSNISKWKTSMIWLDGASF